jgi:tyrosyl-tRNA synthetase
VKIPLEKVNAANSRDLADESKYFLLDNPQLPGIRLVWLNKVLVEAGFAASGTEASRKIEEKAVRVDDTLVTRVVVSVLPNTEKVVRLGKKIKRVSITLPD